MGFSAYDIPGTVTHCKPLNPHGHPTHGPYYPCFTEEDTGPVGSNGLPGSQLFHGGATSVFLDDCSAASHLLPSVVPFFLPGEGLSENLSEQSPSRSHQSGFSQRGSISSRESGHCSCSSQTGVPGQGKWDQRPRRCWGWSGEEDQAVAQPGQGPCMGGSNVATITLWWGLT